MDRRIWLAYFASCAAPGVLIGFANGYRHGMGDAVGAAFLMALLFGIVGMILTGPVALPLLAIAVWRGCLRFWSSFIGSFACGALTVVLYLSLHHQIFSTLARKAQHVGWLLVVGGIGKMLLMGGAFGLVCGVVFAGVLSVTGYFDEQQGPRLPWRGRPLDRMIAELERERR